MYNYLIATAFVTIIFLLIHIKSILYTVSEEKFFNRKTKEPSLFESMSLLNEQATELDEIPQGYGRFGFDKTNPIPIKHIIDSEFYLGDLKTKEGEKTSFERIGSVKAPNIEMPIDAYKIYSKDTMITTLFLSPYHKKTSTKAPENFIIRGKEPVVFGTPAFKNKMKSILAKFLAGVFANLILISIGMLFFTYSFFDVIVYSIINAFWMPFILLPVLEDYRIANFFSGKF
jgi:hypothetical protein